MTTTTRSTWRPPAWRDPSTRTHCVEHLNLMLELLACRVPYFQDRASRVEKASQIVGRHLQLKPDELFALSLAARFHDIGMLGIPDQLLSQTGPLTPEQRKRIDTHTRLGGRLIHKVFPDYPDAVEAIWWHHERPDGTGPYRLQGDEIPLIASIVALVEAVESMANGRSYRKPMGFREIVAEVERHSGRQFVPSVVAAFQSVAAKVYKALCAQPGAPTSAPSSAGSGKPHPGDRPAPSPQRSPGAPGGSAQTAGSGAPSRKGEAPPASAGAKTHTVVMDTGMRSLTSLNELDPLITKDELLKLVNEGLKLRPLALTAQRVMGVTSRAQCSAEDVAKVVLQDQALSIRILKVANSSAYSRGRTVDSVKDAVSRIGVNEVRNMVLAMAVLERYGGHASQYVDARFFWEHSIACGLISGAIGKECEKGPSDDYFLWGVLHDVGRLVLLDHVPDTYARVCDTAAELDVPLEGVEARLMLLDHCDILRRAMEHWCFPREFVAPVVSHHQSVYQFKRLEPSQTTRAASVALANRLAHALLLGSSGNDVVYPLDDVVDLLKLEPSVLVQLAENVPEETQSLKFSMLAQASAQEWPDFASEIKGRLCTALRPLCVSEKPEIDAYRLFCERISEPPEEGPPNLGVMYLYDARKQDLLTSDFDARERKAGVERLPVLVVFQKGKINPEYAWLKARPHAVLRAPVRMARLVDVINRLLGGDA